MIPLMIHAMIEARYNSVSNLLGYLVRSDRWLGGDHYLGSRSANLQVEGGKTADCCIVRLNHRNCVTILAHASI